MSYAVHLEPTEDCGWDLAAQHDGKPREIINKMVLNGTSQVMQAQRNDIDKEFQASDDIYGLKTRKVNKSERHSLSIHPRTL